MKLRRKKRFKSKSWRGSEGFFVIWGRRVLFVAAILGIAVFLKWNSTVNRGPQACIDCDIIANSTSEESTDAETMEVLASDHGSDNFTAVGAAWSKEIAECVAVIREHSPKKLSYLTLDSSIMQKSQRALSTPLAQTKRAVVADAHR